MNVRNIVKVTTCAAALSIVGVGFSSDIYDANPPIIYIKNVSTDQDMRIQYKDNGKIYNLKPSPLMPGQTGLFKPSLNFQEENTPFSGAIGLPEGCQVHYKGQIKAREYGWEAVFTSITYTVNGDKKTSCENIQSIYTQRPHHANHNLIIKVQ